VRSPDLYVAYSCVHLVACIPITFKNMNRLLFELLLSPKGLRLVADCINMSTMKSYADHVAARSKARTVFARSNTGLVGSNPTQSTNVCVRLFCVCDVLCVGSSHATG
jgi:hypothetical protein